MTSSGRPRRVQAAALAPGVAKDALLRFLHPDRDEAAPAARGPRLLPAPCGEYITRVPYGPCTTCGRTRMAHELAGAPWTENDDGGTP